MAGVSGCMSVGVRDGACGWAELGAIRCVAGGLGAVQVCGNGCWTVHGGSG